MRSIDIVADVVRQRGNVTVCETGFNVGHSASLWLSVSPNVSVVSFDLMRHSVQARAEAYLRRQPGVGERLRVVSGDSAATLLAARRQRAPLACDVSHASAPGREHADLVGLRELSYAGGAVMPTAHTRGGVTYGFAWKHRSQHIRIAQHMLVLSM